MADDEKDTIGTVDDKWYITNAEKLKEILGISKLKGYIDEHIKEIHERSHNQADKIDEKISELRNEWKLALGCKEDWKIWDVVTELKERVEGIYKSVHGIAPDEPDIIKEVLRDFRKWVRDLILFLKWSSNLESLEENDMTLEELLHRHDYTRLSKLDGDSKKAWEFAEKVIKEKNDGEKTTVVATKVYKEVVADIIKNDSTPSKYVSAEEDYYDPQKEECEHNRPFWECEICGNTRKPKEPPEAMIPEKTIIKLQEYGIMKFLEEDDIVVKKADLEKLLYGNLDERLQLRKKYLKEAKPKE